MINKQTATLGFQLLSVMDKLFTLTAPVPGPLLFFTGHPNYGQRVFVPSQVAIQAQAESVTISAVSLHSGIGVVELLRGNDVAVCASLQQRTVEPVAKPTGFIDDMDCKAFPQSPFDPGHEFRGSKTMRRARRSVVVLSHHDEFLPMDIESNLEQRAAPLYLRVSRRGCGGHTVENGVILHRAGESTKDSPASFTCHLEQPVCEQAVAVTLGGLQELELLTLFAKHFHIQVAVGLDPILVDLDGQSPNQSQAALSVGKDADDMGATLKLLMRRTRFCFGRGARRYRM
jgi:hypothetical protein